MNVTEKNFNLKQLTIKGETVRYQGIVSYSEGDITYESKVNSSDTRIPHPDLEVPFKNNFKKFACDALGLLEVSAMMPHCTEEQKTSLEKLSFVFDRYYESLVENINVETIKFNGAEKSSGIVIKGKRRLFSGKSVPFETPSITLSASVYGWEDDLIEEVDYIKSNAYSYIYMNKHANPTMEFPGENNDEGTI